MEDSGIVEGRGKQQRALGHLGHECGHEAGGCMKECATGEKEGGGAGAGVGEGAGVRSRSKGTG